MFPLPLSIPTPTPAADRGGPVACPRWSRSLSEVLQLVTIWVERVTNSRNHNIENIYGSRKGNNLRCECFLAKNIPTQLLGFPVFEIVVTNWADPKQSQIDFSRLTNKSSIFLSWLRRVAPHAFLAFCHAAPGSSAVLLLWHGLDRRQDHGFLNCSVSYVISELLSLTSKIIRSHNEQ